MARIVILGGGFAGVVTAEALAQQLGSEHVITLIARQRKFTFFGSLAKQVHINYWARAQAQSD